MKKILSFIMSAVCIFLLLAMCGSVYASDNPTVKLSSASALQGDEVEIIVSIENNIKGFWMLEMNITFDNEALEFVGCESKLLDGLNQLPEAEKIASTIPIIYCNTPLTGGNVTFENVEGDCELFVLTFKIKDQAAAGIYNLVLDVTNASYVDNKGGTNKIPNLDVHTENGSITVASTVSGQVYGFLDATAPITIALYSGDTLVNESVVYNNNASYAFKSVASGEYTLKMSKANHISRELTVTVDGEDVVVQDVTLDIYGDVNKDREIDDEDLDILSRYLAKWANYSVDFAAADVNADGKVNNLDRAILSRYLAKWEGYTSLPCNP